MFVGDDKTKQITMTEGDFGVSLPLEIILDAEETISEIDSFSIKIFDEVHGNLLVEKHFTNIQDNTIELQLTQEESALLPVGEYDVGKYYYDLDWYQNQVFMDNLLAKKPFIVEKKAGGINAS